MSEKFKGKYRNESARLQNWDYGMDAAYFITICTKDREHFFGEIKNGQMQNSPAGAIAIAFVLWNEIKNHAKNVGLGEFVVMPNHVHGILMLNGNESNPIPTVGTTPMVGTTHALSLLQSDIDASSESPKTIGQQRFQNQGKNTVSSIVGSYKSAVTKYCNKLNFPFAWQPRFHDHIIRNDESFQRISEYIINNPMNWSEDRFFKI